jgi:hypothetical protein
MTDGEREIRQEQERDARDAEEAMRAEEEADGGGPVDWPALAAALHDELDAAEIAADWAPVGDDENAP